MNATHFRAIAAAAVAAADSTALNLDVTVDNLRTVTIDGTGQQLIIDLTWLSAKGERNLRLGCPR